MEQTTKLFQVKEKLESQGFLSDAEFSAPNLTKLLSVSAFPRISLAECETGEIRLTGVVEYKIVYVTDDNQVDSASITKDFYERILVKQITPNTEIYLKASAEEVEYGASNPVRIRTTVEISGWYLKTLTVTECSCPEAQTLSETVEIDSVKILRDSVTEIAKEAEFPGGIDKVLSAEATININSVSPATEIAYVEGECVISVVYLINGSVQETKVNADFNTEILSPNLTAESVVTAEGFAIAASAVTVDEKTILAEVTAVIKGTVSTKEETTVLKDVYSLSHRLETESATERYKKCVCRELLSDRVEAHKRLSADEEKIRAVLATSLPSVQGLTVSAEELGFGDDRYHLVAEGVLVVKAIYLSEAGGLHSVLVEAPFQMTSRETVCPGATTFAADRVRVTAYSLKQRLPDELELNATVAIDAAGFSDTEVSMLVSVTEKEELPEDNTAISLYITDAGESLWNVAKTLRTTEEDLMNQNPELTLPLAGGEKIISYREL